MTISISPNGFYEKVFISLTSNVNNMGYVRNFIREFAPVYTNKCKIHQKWTGFQKQETVFVIRAKVSDCASLYSLNTQLNSDSD